MGRPGFGNWGASPFALMRQMQDEMDRMFSQFFGGPGAGAGEGLGGMEAWAPTVDVQETDKEYLIHADIPGVEPEDLELLCTDDHLILRGETRRQEESRDKGYLRSERRYGRFERVLPLPGEVKQDQIQANFRNGVLELRLPKSEEAQQRMRRIPVQGGRSLSGAKGGEVSGGQEAGGGQSQGATSGPATGTATPAESRSTEESGSAGPGTATGPSTERQHGSRKS